MSEREFGGMAARLREEFDRTFGEHAAPRPPPQERFLTLRVGDDRFAVSMADIAGLHKDASIAPIPSALPELLGIAAFRGRTVPVYDLRAILGGPASTDARWLVLSGGEAQVGLAFDEFDANVTSDREVAIAEGDGAMLRGAITAPSGVLRIIDVASVVESIARRAAPPRKV